MKQLNISCSELRHSPFKLLFKTVYMRKRDRSDRLSLFNGKIDETAIFNKVLTQAEVSQVYNNGYAADLTSLSPISWWRLGEDAYFVGNDITIPNQISARKACSASFS